MRSLRSRESYLLNDQSAVLGGKREEHAMATCCHCQAQVFLNPLRTRDRNFCRKCYAYVCDNPTCVLECNGSLNRVLDKLQEDAFKAQFRGQF